jgi:Xaa-Pro aminopeptidase
MVKHRLLKATDTLKIHGLHAMLFTDMVNVRYLTGFTGTDGALLLTKTDSVFFCDSRYTTQASGQVTCEVVEYKNKLTDLVDHLSQNNLKKVGFESSVISVADFNQLKKNSGVAVEWIPVEDFSSLRIIKDEAEIALIEQATQTSALAFDSVLPMIVPGQSESSIALSLEIAIRRQGAEEKSFDFIVASGERGALPHGVASDKIIESTDLVTIDYGCRFNGYCSDETVTLAMGKPAKQLRKIHDIVLKAHDLAIAKIKPGVLLKDIDAVARGYIDKSGYGAYFGHGLGHGVGLQVHEAPRVSPLSKGLTEVGMVFTVEPGIYLPGLGGVRIEDIIVVTSDGCRILTRLPKKYCCLH